MDSVFPVTSTHSIIRSSTDIMTYFCAKTDCPAKACIAAFLSCSYASAVVCEDYRDFDSTVF